VSIGSGVLLYQGKEKQLLPGLVRELWRGTNGLEILVQYCAFPTQLADIQLDHLLLDGDEGEALPLPSNMLQPVTCDCACADAELVLTNEWGWEDASSVQQLCTIVRYDQYRSMYKLDHLRKNLAEGKREILRSSDFHPVRSSEVSLHSTHTTTGTSLITTAG
jgi:hypothetical protein